MNKIDNAVFVSPSHPLEDETMKHSPNLWNKERNINETSSLKVLAYKVLERSQRNMRRNKSEIKGSKNVSLTDFDETKSNTILKSPLVDLTSLSEDYEERYAIAEYDGCQTPFQAQRIAYQDSFISILNDLPIENTEELQAEGWLNERIKTAQACLSD